MAIAPDVQLPQTPHLEQNCPNPFNASTRVNFSLPASAHVSLRVYSLLGKEVARLIEQRLPAGEHTMTWDARGLGSGIYYLIRDTNP